MKCALYIFLLITAACAVRPQSSNYETQAAEIIAGCNKKLETGEYTLVSEMITLCQKPQLIKSFTFHRDGRDLDLFTQSIDHRITVAKDVEANNLTIDQATDKIQKFEAKLTAIHDTRLAKREAKAKLAMAAVEKKRRDEERRLAEYYKKHPHEYEMLLKQEQQLRLLEQQNQILQQQQVEQARAEERRRFSEALSNLSDSLARNAARRPVHCNTHYGYASSSTTCY